ncbi:cation-transporting P-type ATPase 13A2 [Nematocida minor]|uniref:cation-transporting P-type ATPase 13A2 n=1 Tax=Nematocida minor TaxID=1912983 RepID=UPI00222029F3|nr:cation-transporting P-type ATPase 13A2 [Nematocida minor]KAI5192589.1 cation-transporting P-type ATPase 13A2 [Nematocida minor]
MGTFNKEKNNSRIVGRKRRLSREVYYTISGMTLGLFHVLCVSFPSVKLHLETKSVSIECADILICDGRSSDVYEEKIEKEDITDIMYEYVRNNTYKYAFVNSTRRVFNWVSQEYHLPNGAGYIETLTRKEREVLFGKNELITRRDGSFHLFFLSLFDSINVYTMFGIILWVYIDYYIYALIIFLLMSYNLVNEVRTEIRKNEQSDRISKTKKNSFLLLQEKNKPSEIVLVQETDIVMDDTLVFIPYSEVPCDCVVVDGTVAVDEGFVTGESVPVLKKKNAEILAGSVILQAIIESTPGQYEINHPELQKFIDSNNYCLVKSVRISYGSARGKAFRNLAEQKLTRPPVYFDTMKIISIIAVIMVPCGISVFVYLQSFLPAHILILYIFDLVYALVSPSLPTAIWIGMAMCSRRLLRKNILCKDISISNVAGNISKVCFDKTGTLTEEGLDIKCINVNGVEVSSIDEISDPLVRQGISLCHSVEKIGDRLVGDPLDIKLLQFAGGSVEYSSHMQKIQRTIHAQEKKVGIIREIFDFDPNIRRMTVISEINGQLYAFSKGSTEAIRDICETPLLVTNRTENSDRDRNTLEISNDDTIDGHISPSILLDRDTADSSINRNETDSNLNRNETDENEIESSSSLINSSQVSNNDELVSKYTRAGYRVISLAYKPVNEVHVDREDAECALHLLCTIVFENKLKLNSRDTINILTQAGISSIMCTGDALFTAVSVGMHCGIVEHHVPVIYPVVPSGAKLCIDAVEWACINDNVVFDKVLMKVRKGHDYSSYIDYAVAIEGHLFDVLMKSKEYKSLLQKRCKVFARMNPFQKSSVVEMYRETDLVCFVGDGANDCNAIQSADVGVSLLSSSDSAVEYCASSYISYGKEVSCLIDIIKEGKCALNTTLSKIEQILIITISQFNALFILLFRRLFMSDMQNIYTDILINIPLSLVMSRFQCAQKLSRKKPKKRLLKKSVIYGIFIHCMTHCVHLFILMQYMHYLHHTNSLPPRTNRLSETSQMASGIFLISNIQALYSGLVYTPGAPFRERKRGNKMFILFYAFHCVMISFLLGCVSGAKFADGYVWRKGREVFDLLPLSGAAVFGIVGLSISDGLIIRMLTSVISILRST